MKYLIYNYNLQPQYDNVSIPPPKPKIGAEALPITGDYKFTQCSAYAPVATTMQYPWQHQ